MQQRTIIMRFTVKPKVSAVCSGGGGADPMVPMQPMQPMNMRMPVPTISAANIVNVFSWIFHISPVEITPVSCFDIDRPKSDDEHSLSRSFCMARSGRTTQSRLWLATGITLTIYTNRRRSPRNSLQYEEKKEKKAYGVLSIDMSSVRLNRCSLCVPRSYNIHIYLYLDNVFTRKCIFAIYISVFGENKNTFLTHNAFLNFTQDTIDSWITCTIWITELLTFYRLALEGCLPLQTAWWNKKALTQNRSKSPLTWRMRRQLLQLHAFFRH